MDTKNFMPCILVITLTLAYNTYPSTCRPQSPNYPTPSTPYAPPTTPYAPPIGSGTDSNCPRNNLNLRVCANVLSGLLGLNVGNSPTGQSSCCSLIQGLIELEAAACLCTAIQANILGINLNVPLSVNLLLSFCGFQGPPGFQCD